MQTDDTMSEVENKRTFEGLDYLLQGLADAWGDGVLGIDSWRVTPGTGALEADIAAGGGLLGKFAGVTTAVTTLTLNDETDNYIWAEVHVGTETDQAWVRTPSFTVRPAATGYTGICLARVGTADGAIALVGDPGEEVPDVEDLRSIIGQGYLVGLIEALQTNTALLFAILGDAYLDWAGVPNDVATRLTALETVVGGLDPGDIEAITVYWGALAKSSADPSTIEQWHIAYHAAQDAQKAGGLARTDWDAVTASLLTELLREEELYGADATKEHRDVYVFSARTSPDAKYDTTHSTATVDRELGMIR
jgi:hypothetical protein